MTAEARLHHPSRTTAVDIDDFGPPYTKEPRNAQKSQRVKKKVEDILFKCDLLTSNERKGLLDATEWLGQDVPYSPAKEGDGSMIQVDMVGFYFMGEGLAKLANLGSTPGLHRKLDILANAEYWLSHFLTPQSVLQCRQSKNLAEHLLKAVREAVAAVDIDTGELNSDIVAGIQTLHGRLGEALAHDLKNEIIFYVPQEGIYSVRSLCANAIEALSTVSQSKLPKEGIEDFNEGGRCLACDFRTAAGFHLLRSVERALRVYYKLVTGRDADKGHLDWGTCIQELKQSKRADTKVLAVLDQIRSLHRNPLMHPEVFLTHDEARGIFQISTSAIDSMTRFFP